MTLTVGAAAEYRSVMRSLAQVQVEADQQRLSKDPALLRRKWTRMSASPFAFLRGASSLWAEALTREPELLEGFSGEGALVGDLHLENFGTFRSKRGFTFHLNDFDETFTGPWAFDVLRLLTSVLLARPELGSTGTAALGLADAVLDGHGIGVRGGRIARPNPIEDIVKHAAAQANDKLLNKYLDDETHIRRGERTPNAPSWAKKEVRSTLQTWAAGTGKSLATVADVCRRIAGTGSLGVERLLVLACDSEEDDFALVEVKEVRGTRFTKAASASRLVETMMQVLPDPPLDLVAARLKGLPVVVKPLLPGEEKLAVTEFPREDVTALCRYYGYLTGEMHRRGATKTARWSKADRARLVHMASHLAGFHEQAFIEFCTAARGVVE